MNDVYRPIEYGRMFFFVFSETRKWGCLEGIGDDDDHGRQSQFQSPQNYP